jgi:hypothetical protein
MTKSFGGALFRWLFQFAGWLLVLLIEAWVFGALWFDFPVPAWRIPFAIAFAILSLLAVLVVRPVRMAQLGICAVSALLFLGWLELAPRNDRNWQSNVAETPWAEVQDDLITLHNIRHCVYEPDGKYISAWTTRSVRLSQLTGIDLALNYWGSEWMSHPILCFTFAGAPPLAFSVEARFEEGESYAPAASLYRQFELVYVVADERDVLQVRTNVRHEDVYLYHSTASAEEVRHRFMEYVNRINALHTKPQWYNLITANCTTSIRAQRPEARRAPFDWRILLNGKLDELLYETGMIETGGLSFADLKKRALINERASAVREGEDFSARIRDGIPGR